MTTEYALAFADYKAFGITGPTFGEYVYRKVSPDGSDVSEIRFEVFRRSDGTEKARAHGSATGRKVYLIHPQYLPPAQHVMVGKQMMDALVRAGAERIYLLEPYNPYFSEDKRDYLERDPVTAGIVLRDYRAATRIISFDPHTPQLEMLPPPDFPAFDTIYLSGPLARYTRSLIPDLSRFRVSPPDQGSSKRAKRYANNLGLQLISLTPDKVRTGNDLTTLENVDDLLRALDNLSGCGVIVRDDVIRTGGTLLKTVDILKRSGAHSIYVCATHLGLYGDAKQRLKEAGVKAVIGTNTLPYESDDFVHVLDVSDLTADLIRTKIERRSLTDFLRDIETPDSEAVLV